MKIKYKPGRREQSINSMFKRLLEQTKAQMDHDRQYNSHVMDETDIRLRALDMLRIKVQNIAHNLIITDWEDGV